MCSLCAEVTGEQSPFSASGGFYCMLRSLHERTPGFGESVFQGKGAKIS